MISNENIELLKEAIASGKTPEQILQEAEAIKITAERIENEKNEAILKLQTLINKINVGEFNGSDLNYIVAVNMLSGTQYKVTDTSYIEEV